jgi:hypothetical protein
MTHAHYFHLLDASYIARARKGILVGNESVARIARAYGLLDEQIITIQGGEDPFQTPYKALGAHPQPFRHFLILNPQFFALKFALSFSSQQSVNLFRFPVNVEPMRLQAAGPGVLPRGDRFWSHHKQSLQS